MKPSPGVTGWAALRPHRARKRTAAPIVAQLDGVINDALKTEALQAALKKLGAVPTIETPEKFAAFIAAEMRKWTEIATVAGIKVD